MAYLQPARSANRQSPRAKAAKRGARRLAIAATAMPQAGRGAVARQRLPGRGIPPACNVVLTPSLLTIGNKWVMIVVSTREWRVLKSQGR